MCGYVLITTQEDSYPNMDSRCDLYPFPVACAVIARGPKQDVTNSPGLIVSWMLASPMSKKG